MTSQYQGPAAAPNSGEDPPLVSVVVLTYNRARLLPETVHAILAQSYRNLELIIVDNLSSDSTPDYVAGLTDSRVRCYRNPNHGVLAVNRNFGIRQARGKYIAFCDDDDVWLPTKLERQVSVLENSSRVALCFTNTLAVRDSSDTGQLVFSHPFGNSTLNSLIWRNFIGNSSVMVRKAVLDRVGLLDEDPALTPYDDYHMWLRVAHSGEIHGIDEPLVRYRVHGAGFSAQLTHRDLLVVRVLLSARRRIGSRSISFWFSAGLRYIKYLASGLRHRIG
jgi:glycosyltransferase involved in cell wall biosynthesis